MDPGQNSEPEHYPVTRREFQLLTASDLRALHLVSSTVSQNFLSGWLHVRAKIVWAYQIHGPAPTQHAEEGARALRHALIREEAKKQAEEFGVFCEGATKQAADLGSANIGGPKIFSGKSARLGQ